MHFSTISVVIQLSMPHNSTSACVLELLLVLLLGLLEPLRYVISSSKGGVQSQFINVLFTNKACDSWNIDGSRLIILILLLFLLRV